LLASKGVTSAGITPDNFIFLSISTSRPSAAGRKLVFQRTTVYVSMCA
jgi:hypothetical protein